MASYILFADSVENVVICQVILSSPAKREKKVDMLVHQSMSQVHSRCEEQSGMFNMALPEFRPLRPERLGRCRQSHEKLFDADAGRKI